MAPSNPPSPRRRSIHPPTSSSPRLPSPLLLLVAAAVVLPSSLPTAFAHIPFGYQLDSSQSWEYRNAPASPSTDPDNPDGLPYDPSTFAGSIHYDPLHHALYATGQTYASYLFDGIDVYGLTSTEQEELVDGDPTNDGYWWEDMVTGLRPHLKDVGMPGYAPRRGDCFYAVFGLPEEEPNPGGEGGGDVELVHSRRFGSEGATEACSAVDVLFANSAEDGPGGYAHAFQPPEEEHAAGTFPSAFGGAAGPPAFAPWTLGSVPTEVVPIAPTISPAATENTGPQSRFLAGEEAGDGREPANELDATGASASEERRKRGERRQQSETYVPRIKTRSVRLLVAGHVEPAESADSSSSGYILSDLSPGQFDEASAYAFAQQIDVRLPYGDLDQSEQNEDVDQLMAEEYEDLDYELHSEAMTEEEFMMGLDPEWMLNIPKEDFAKIVTSGVESRALLNDSIPRGIRALYPVALVADPTSKKHYYVAMLASEDPDENVKEGSEYLNVDKTIGEGATQRSWTDYPNSNDVDFEDEFDNFGMRGRPGRGSDYRVIVKKIAIEADLDTSELTDSEKALSSESFEGRTIAMKHTWVQEYKPDLGEDVRPSGLLFVPSGDPSGDGDVLILAGTTAGRGSAFGTMSENSVTSTGEEAPVREDLDGFIAKIRADDGNFAGKPHYDSVTHQFENMHSLRIQTVRGMNEMVAGVCAKSLADVGEQVRTTHVYVAGTTQGILPALAGTRDDAFLNRYQEGRNPLGADSEAFLMKVDLGTMDVVWTVQVGAFVPGEEGMRGDVFGYGCAVTRDGEDVYLTGLVKENGVVTDFSTEDGSDPLPYQAAGGTDVFVASYKTSDGSRNFLRQVGSTADDHPARGNGGIDTDKYGNAILTGSTRGSLMRKRIDDEYKYGEKGTDAPADMFIMSFERTTANHVESMSGVADAIGPALVPGEIVPGPTPVPQPEVSQPAVEPETSKPVGMAAEAEEAIQEGLATEAEVEKKSSALIAVVAIALAFILIVAASGALLVYRIKVTKQKERRALDSDHNLHDSRSGGKRNNLHAKRSSSWAAKRSSASSAMKDFSHLDIMVEVRNSASGGWHGVYDDEQLQAIDFGVPSAPAKEAVEHEKLFTEEGLKEIEDGLESYEIGDMDDVSDEDLIKAYNDAMALDIEPENPDVELTMAGFGSCTLEGELPKLT